jgi:S1-C subfamily serine protease
VIHPSEAPWRLLVHGDAGQVLGAGFLISAELALTCDHVVRKNKASSCLVQLGGSGAGRASARQIRLPAAGRADVAVLRLDEPARGIGPAPAGPAEPPPAGARLEAFGFPGGGGGLAAAAGIWAPVLVNGYDLAAQQIQLTSHSPHGLPVTRGFSGGPVIDPQSALVVGMVASVWDAQRISMMIPIHAIAACSPELRAILLPRAPVDREFSRGLELLARRNYAAALADFRLVCARHPGKPDTWYYVALSALKGQRPRAHPTAYVDEISRLLEQAAQLAQDENHVLALWGLLKEDHYRARGMSEGTPPSAELRAACSSVSPGHAAEICRHVPAPETLTWQELNRRGNP